MSAARAKPVMSTADRLRAEGRAEGRAETLLQLLAARFGAVTTTTTNRVRSASLADLERWTLRVLDARTIADVFAAD